MKNKVLVIILCIVLIIVFSGCNNVKRITGNEWLIVQESCFDDLESFCAGMDDVYALYISGGITASDFAVEVAILKEQYKMMYSSYEELKKNNPIQPESHSYLSQVGSEAMNNIYLTIEATLNASLDSTGQALSIDNIAYMYLAQRQELTEYISQYTSAVAWVRAANGEWNDDSTIDEMVFS